MKIFSTRVSFRKLAIPSAGAFLLVTLATVNGCTQSDRSTDAREEVITQNALEAEAAEANIAAKKQEPVTKTAGKSAATEKSAKVAKSEKPAKKEAHKPESAVKNVAKEITAEKAAQKSGETSERKPAAAGAAGGTYVVQVGAFKLKENADKLQAKLMQAGYSVQTQIVDHSKNGTLHLVRFQPTTNRAEAETLVEDLHSKQDLKAQIINAH